MRKTKKTVYIISSVILAVLFFVMLFIFDQDKSWDEVRIDSSSPPQQEESSSPPPEEDSSSSAGNEEEDSGGSSGDEPTEGNGGGGDDPSVLFRVTSNTSHYPMYLRENGFSSYTGNGEHGFTGTERYYPDDGEINPLYYFATVLENNGYPRNTATVELKKFKGDLLPYHSITGTNRAPEQMEYSIDYYAYDFLTNGIENLAPLSGAYASQEIAYRQNSVERYYLDIDWNLKILLLDLADEHGISVQNDIRTIALQVVNYIQNSAYYDYYWADRNYPADKDMVTYFLTEEKAGVCRHFAASATMMFRALGIPARYAIGFAVPVTAGEWTEWQDAGHAWTEIYLNGYGWVPLEVTGSNLAPPRPDEPTPDEEDGVVYAYEPFYRESYYTQTRDGKRRKGGRV